LFKIGKREEERRKKRKKRRKEEKRREEKKRTEEGGRRVVQLVIIIVRYGSSNSVVSIDLSPLIHVIIGIVIPAGKLYLFHLYLFIYYYFYFIIKFRNLLEPSLFSTFCFTKIILKTQNNTILSIMH
jgi:hypothetical protein